MTLVIGTDEAGYGPNLGPLVVAATAWRLDAAPDEVERILAEAVAAATADATRGTLWADSKTVYKPSAARRAGGVGHPIERLEHGVLVAAAVAAGSPPRSWPALEAVTGPLGPDAADDSPQWHALGRTIVPLAADATRAERAAADVRQALADRGVGLLAVRVRCVYPGNFNGQLQRGLNKSDVLSRTTLDLAAMLAGTMRKDHAEPLVVWCDRHGGRKRYAAVVAEAFASLLDGSLARPVEETAARSAYRLGEAGSIEFSVGGESRTPVAIASMAAKYGRERTMECFNAFWSGRVPGLRPTAGYPEDAVRWRRESRDAVAESGVAEDQLWRRA